MFFLIILFVCIPFGLDIKANEEIILSSGVVKKKSESGSVEQGSSYKKHRFKDKFKIAFYLEEDHELITLLKSMLEKSGYFLIDVFSKKKSLDTVYKKAKERDCLFLLDLEITDNFLNLQIFNVFDESFLMGKGYKFARKKDLFLRNISADIYQALLADVDNPFEQFVIFLDKGDQKNRVMIFSPFGVYEHVVLTTKKVFISDIGVYDAESIWCGLIYPRGVAFKRVMYNQEIEKLGMFSGTPGSLIKSGKDLFFILSGSIYRHVYEKGKFKGKPFLVSSKPLASLCLGPDNSLFYTDGKSICQCWYDGHFNIIKEAKFQYKKRSSLSPYYNKKKDILVFTADIEGYSQLIAYDFSSKTYSQLTTSSYHKMDPAFLGDYIVYSACPKNSALTHLEVLNIETGHIEAYKKENNMYLCPGWMESKIKSIVK